MAAVICLHAKFNFKMFKVHLVLLSIICQPFLLISGSIHHNLRSYDILHASDVQHTIVKRGVKHSNHPFNVLKDVRFSTLGKDFRLILHPNKEVLHSNFQAYTVDGEGKETPFIVEHDEFFHGRVFGEMKSHAHVHIEDGVLTASIHMEHDIYHIEPKWRHLPDRDNKSMIAYRESDVKLSWKPTAEYPTEQSWPRTCGYVKEEIDDELTEGSNPEIQEAAIHSREKRQNDQYEYTPTKTRCPLLLIADYRFYQEMGSSNTKTTINYLINLIDRVHKLYNDTTWQDGNEKDGFKGMGFVIKKIVVHSEPTRVRGGELHYNMIRDKWDVRNLLEVFSREYSHKDFCLAHLFTDLKFEGGILGLAYVGSPRRNSVGGICTPEYFKNGYTLYLNSGLSSSRNHYGQRVITREADLVTAHELGHNFGSEHDPDIPECSPSASQGGSYLMYTYSVSGYDVNNKKFSPCSLRSIRKVLLAKSGRCFTEPEESFCGNLRVEGDEECDAGLLGTEDNDACCDKNCKLRRKQGAMCSDKNTPCCQNCQYMKAAVKCREAQYATCEKESRCNGISAECPKSPAMEDNTPCLEKGQCKDGKCVPYCETKGQLSCMCDDLLNACKRCCRNHLNDTCAPDSSEDILSDGTPCVQGFCNQGICEKTIQDVVERFWDIIEEISINKVLKFLKDNIVGATIVVSAVFWIPASMLSVCCHLFAIVFCENCENDFTRLFLEISYTDRIRRIKIRQRQEWNKRNELLHPLDTRKVIRTKMTSRRLFSQPVL